MGTHPEIPWEASGVDDFLAHEAEPDDLRDLVLIEVAANRVADLAMQIGRPTAAVKIDSPRARAVKPSPLASSTRKTTSGRFTYLARELIASVG
jgi:hypothetical protein